MTVKKDIRKILEESYSIGELKKITTDLGADVNSKTVKLVTKKGAYILKIYSKHKLKHVVKEARIMHFCNVHGISVPEVVETTEGTLFFENEKCGFIQEFITGHTFKGSQAELEALAEGLARLHSVLAKYTETSEHPSIKEYQWLKDRTLDDFKRIEKDNPRFERKYRENIDRIKMLMREIRNEERTIRKLSHQLVHGDLTRNNVLFKNGKVAAFIDFNTVHLAPRASDVAFAGIRFSMDKDKAKMKKKLAIFLAAYEAKARLSHQEKTMLYALFVRVILQRIMWIIRGYYFENNNAWIGDFEKHLYHLEAAEVLKPTI